jgi:hypothetical protein
MEWELEGWFNELDGKLCEVPDLYHAHYTKPVLNEEYKLHFYV